MSQLASELRLAARGMARAPGFAVVTVLTLALGIGATTAVFSLVHGVVLSPLPYPDAEELVWVGHLAPGVDIEGDIGMARGLLPLYRERSETLLEIGLWRNRGRTLTSGGDPERISVSEATASLFEVLGARPLHGRLTGPEDDAEGSERVAVLGHGLWQRRFGGDPGIVGETVDLDRVPVTVVGVLPPDFRSPEPATQLWLDADPIDLDSFGGFNARAIARTRPGVGVDAVRRDLNARIAEYGDRAPPVGQFLEDARVTSNPVPLKEWVVGDAERTMWVLMGTVGFVLLIACANVANLTLLRAEGRRRDTAVRVALGATRGRLVRHFLAEGGLLALLGGGLGLAVAFVGVRSLVRWAPVSVPRLGTVGVDPVVLAFTAAVTLAVAVVFGLAPALGTASGTATSLRDGGRSATAGRGRLRARQALVVSQVTLALLLIVGAGLMARSFWNLSAVDPGFEPSGVLSFELALPASSYETVEAAADFHARLLERLRALPGVSSAGATLRLPLSGPVGGNLLAEEGHPPDPGAPPPLVWVNRATEGYFETLRIPLVAGRTIERADLEQDRDVAVLSTALAELYWPGEDPLGKRITFSAGGDPAWSTVVGVVGTVKVETLMEDPRPMMWVPPLGGDYDQVYALSYAVRTAVPPLSLADEVRRTVWEMDSGLALVRLRSLEEAVADAQAPMAFSMVLLLLAAGVALVLGSVGVYGVLSYLVRQRNAEIGVRLALGARAADVRRMLLSQGAVIAAVGLGLGLGASLAMARLLEAMLFAVEPLDPLTHLSAVAVLGAVVLLATWIPARRAARVDPVVVLKGE